MEQIAAALGDRARWHIVTLLARQPRSVGELAELTGLRQPQTTKHLQTLARAGVVTVTPLGQRRVYSLEAAPLAALARQLRELTESVEAHAGDRDVLARYHAAIEADTGAADRDRWADGRTLAFERDLPAAPEAVWRHWTDAALLASWWSPPSMRITECVLDPRPGGDVVLEYRDADGRYRSTGRVVAADAPGHLVFDLSVLDAAGAVAFTGHHDLTLTAGPGGTRLGLTLRLTATTPGALPFVAGLEPGWNQVLDHLTAVLAPRKEPRS